MKKIITICLLAITILAGGMTMDAKTTKKKSKARTSQTSSTKWNGDIPSAMILEGFFIGGVSQAQKDKYKSQFIAHGYTFEDYDSIATKDDVCEIKVTYFAQSIEMYIEVYDSAKRDWLFNNIRSLIKSKKSDSRFYNAYMENDTIYFMWSKWAYR